MRIGVLASTNATDMQAIIDAITAGELDAEIAIVIANKACGALERARQHSLPAVLLESKGFKEREDYDRKVA